MKQIMNKFDSKKEPSVEELRKEVNALKEEIKGIKSRLNKVEIDAITEKLLKEVTKEVGSSKGVTSDNEEPEDDDKADSEAGINAITKIRPQSSHIMIKLVVNDNLTLNKIALLDSGADRNYIIEGLIPTKYVESVIPPLEGLSIILSRSIL